MLRCILLLLLLFGQWRYVILQLLPQGLNIATVDNCPEFSKYSRVEIVGPGSLSAQLGKEVFSISYLSYFYVITFFVQAFFDLIVGLKPPAGDAAVFNIPQRANDSVWQARLFGTSIVSAHVQETAMGRYRISYTLRDAGEYLLQVSMIVSYSLQLTAHSVNGA
jgi:flavin-binding protein dodecin